MVGQKSITSIGPLKDDKTKPLGPEDIKRREEIKKIITEFPDIQQITSIYFKDSDSANIQLKPTVRCLHNINVQQLIREVFIKRWTDLTDPRIVVLIISNVGPIHNWRNEKQIKSFQNGLMKAAESTNMWLICNGLNMGATTLIGEAVTNYRTEVKYKRQIIKDKMSSKLNFIGVADEDMIKYLPSITQNEEDRIEINSEGTYDPEKYELNQNLSHYVLIKDKSNDKNGVNNFLENFIHFLSTKMEKNDKQSSHPNEELLPIETIEVPVVAVIIKGGYGSSRLVLAQIKQKIPVVVLRGSGGLADLLSFVEIEIRERCLNSWNPDFVENYLKSELTKRIIETFDTYRNNTLLLSRFRHRILESVRLSRSDGQQYMTIINMFDSYSCNLENLTEYMLSALFKTQQSAVIEVTPFNLNEVQKPNPSIIKRDLKLCVDWNCPEVAKKEVLSKDPSFALNEEKRLFEDSLISKNRWTFVDLFLSSKFKLRTFVSPKRLIRMFRKIHSNDFFQSVCWQTILGLSPQMSAENKKKLFEKFIYRELNWLVEACTGMSDFFSKEELDQFVLRQYPYSEKEAERKALEMIVFWAILDFRKKLVRILWRHSDRPIHLALIIAMSLERLSWYVSEESIKEELKSESKIFVTFAITVLDQSYKDSVVRSLNVLNETQNWDHKTAVDLAAFGRFRQFFSHPSVQRCLSNRFSGNIAIQEVRHKWIPVPRLIKVLLSAYWVFPIYWWIRLTNIPKLEEEEDKEEEEEDDKKEVKEIIDKNDKTLKSKDISEIDAKSKSNVEKSLPEELAPKDKPTDKKPTLIEAPDLMVISKINEKYTAFVPSIWTMVYELWTAPITKFWNYQFFYTFYLSVFSTAVLFPRCGNYLLDLVVIVWTVLLIVDDCRQTYIFSRNNSNVSLKYRLSEILFKTLFVIIYSLSRLLNNPLILFSPYVVKVIICLGLLQAFYVLFSVFLPISSTLGPLLYRLKIMVLVDFLNFIRLSILVMISFGVVIQAILYPDLSINNEMLRQGFHRAFFTLFTSYVDELLENEDCKKKLGDNAYCSASPYIDETCRVTGFVPYIFMIMYMILLKLILMTLLFALFAASANALTADTDAIWKFQRYALVQDFVTKGPLPPPLSIIYYIYLFFKWICSGCCCELRNKPFKLKEFFELFKDYTNTKSQTRLLSDGEYTYFRHLASETYDEFENTLTPESISANIREMCQYMCDQIQKSYQSISNLEGMLSGMHRTIQNSYSLLESIHTIHMNQRHTKASLEAISRKGLHILSRCSPYPNTNVQRYPVPDKYVSWDVMFVDYDPVAHTKRKDDFDPSIKDLVDGDVLHSIEIGFEKDRNDVPVLEWNRMSTNACVDRQSWEQIDGQNIIYKLDNGLPVNPNGRTGLRGRGSLPRWGPNHYVLLVITRAQIGDELEVLTEKIDKNSNTMSLLSRFIPAEITYKPFEVLFTIEDPNLKDWTKAEKMVEFFKKHDSDSIVRIEGPNRSYFDDPLNTDQAWKEVELWHFHFSNGRALNGMIGDTLKWYKITENFFSALNLSHSVVIQTIVEKNKKINT